MNALIDLTGQAFGEWTVLSRVTPARHTTWHCRCSCGAEGNVFADHLRRGYSKSCGAGVHRSGTDSPRYTHGGYVEGNNESGDVLVIWRGIIDRCENPNSRIYKFYGGRGVSLWPKWRSDFAAFRDEIGPRPSREYSIDRWPNKNGNYEPGNIRWATRKEQARNTRRNVLVTIDGREMSLAEAAERAGLNYHVVRSRVYRGWTPLQALAGSR